MESPAEAENTEDIGRLRNIYGFIRNVSWFISAYIALAGFILIKNFGFDIVRVNNKDMLGTYQHGDAVIIKKSLNKYNTNDIIYFRYPLTDSLLSATYMMQRIFGLPGDSLEIKDKEVYLNGMKILDTSSIKNNYYVKSICKLDSNFKVEFNLVEGGEISDSYDYSFSLTREECEKLRAHPYIVSIDLKTEKAGSFDEACFPYSTYFPWNSDFYGKIYIPKKNDTLKLDSVSIKLYAGIISEHEKNMLRQSQDSIIINGELSSIYVVKKNYYFVLGDNRGNANDSRNWGYLPENCISGKVVHTIRRAK
jgi:signal peptidase I